MHFVEISKLTGNSFRDLDIAYPNVLAAIAVQDGADVNQMTRRPNMQLHVQMHSTSLCVGGPCLPKDPSLLGLGVPPEYVPNRKIWKRDKWTTQHQCTNHISTRSIHPRDRIIEASHTLETDVVSLLRDLLHHAHEKGCVHSCTRI